MKIALVSAPCGDWVGLYIDGRLDRQGHSFSLGLVLERLVGGTVESVAEFECDQTWLEEKMGGTLPSKLSQVQR